MADKNSLIADFKALGIKPGMNLLTHSSLRRIGPVDGGADTVIDALLEVLGKDGTLMMSTVSGNVNTEQPVYDVRNTPSTVGTLSNVFRKRPGVQVRNGAWRSSRDPQRPARQAYGAS